ncbi:MAG: Hsp20/alpha crystallin family protein [Candidatus Methylomirabilota bacterium]
MAIVQWDPFRDLVSIQDRMNRMFEQTLSRSRLDEGVSAATWTPAVDIYETKDRIVLKAELPGVTSDEVDIQVQEHALTLKGERRFAKDTQEENYLRIERAYGPFQRSFTLPAGVRQEGIRATFKDGVLEVVMPKADEAKTTRIPIDLR